MSSIIVGWGIFSNIGNLSLRNILSKKDKVITKPYIVFLVGFVSCFLVYISFLFLVKWPGIVTSDSLSQIRQVLSGKYTNHHPFWHTMIIKMCFCVGSFFHGM